MASSPNTQPSWKEAMATTLSEAAEALDSSSAEGAQADDAEALEAADPADEAAGEAEGDTGSSAEDGTEDAAGDEGEGAEDWTGDPDTIPAHLKSAFDKAVEARSKKREAEMSVGVQKYIQKLTEQKQALDEQMRQVQFMQMQMQQQRQAPAQDLGPARPADEADPKEWDRYYDERAAWVADQRFEARMRQAMESGAIPDPARMQAVTVQAEQQARLQFVANLPGCTQETMLKMADLAKGDENLHALMDSNKGAETLFKLAQRELEIDARARKAAGDAEVNARRGAEAHKGAVPRPGGVRKTAEAAGLPEGKTFRNVREKIEYLSRQD